MRTRFSALVAGLGLAVTSSGTPVLAQSVRPIQSYGQRHVVQQPSGQQESQAQALARLRSLLGQLSTAVQQQEQQRAAQARNPLIKPTDELIAPNVRMYIPNDRNLQTPEEKLHVQKTNANILNGMTIRANSSSCEQARSSSPYTPNRDAYNQPVLAQGWAWNALHQPVQKPCN